MESDSLRNPQLVPSDECWVVLQDHGPEGGGWGPATIHIPSLGTTGPLLYTGRDPKVLLYLTQSARELHEATGKKTKLCMFTNRVDIVSFGDD